MLWVVNPIQTSVIRRSDDLLVAPLRLPANVILCLTQQRSKPRSVCCAPVELPSSPNLTSGTLLACPFCQNLSLSVGWRYFVLQNRTALGLGGALLTT